MHTHSGSRAGQSTTRGLYFLAEGVSPTRLLVSGDKTHVGVVDVCRSL